MKSKLIMVVKLLIFTMAIPIGAILFTSADKYVIGDNNFIVLLLLLIFLVTVGLYSGIQLYKGDKKKKNTILVVISVIGSLIMGYTLINFLTLRQSFMNTVVVYSDGACIDFKSDCIVELSSNSTIEYNCKKGKTFFDLKMGKVNPSYEKPKITEFNTVYKIVGDKTIIQYQVSSNILLENNRFNNDLPVTPYKDCSSTITDFTKVINIKKLSIHKD